MYPCCTSGGVPQLCASPSWAPRRVRSRDDEFFTTNMATNQPHKKRLLDRDSDGALDTAFVFPSKTNNWPKFIVLESVTPDVPLTKLSPFAIQKGISGIAGTVKDVKKMMSGQVLVECSKKSHADNLLHCNSLGGVPVRTFPHPHLNSCKGVIRTRDLHDMDEADIATELKDQGVTHVKRITLKREDKIIKTGTYILTFNLHDLPERLLVGYLSVPVDKYVPNPLRCFKCQKFGHGSASCKNKPVCCTCGEDGHELICTRPPKCCNCQGNHAASSRVCPVWIKEQEIQRVRVMKKMSYPQARREVEGFPAYKFQQSFVSVVKPPARTVDCQTDFTWMNRDKPQLINANKSSCTSSRPKTSSQSSASQTSVMLEPSQPAKEKKKSSINSSQPKSSQDLVKSNQAKSGNPMDVEVREPSTHRSRSYSPKSRSKGPVPIFPT